MSHRVYRRWDQSQIRQHQLLIVCFTTLIITGMPLRFASTRGAQIVISAVGGPTVAGWLHRLAAAGMILLSLWHVAYLFRRWLAGSINLAMLPSWSDLRDCLHLTAYFLGRRDDRPRYGRYSFIEKFEYWAVVWGSLIMIGSGLVLWFPVSAARLVPGVWLEVAKVIHGYEALLAGLSILIWHMYHAHLSAEFFPMNRVWLTGTMTEEEMEEHHPRELEAIRAAEARQAADAVEAPDALDAAETDQDHDGPPTEPGPSLDLDAGAPDGGLRPPADTIDPEPDEPTTDAEH